MLRLVPVHDDRNNTPEAVYLVVFTANQTDRTLASGDDGARSR